MKEKNKDISFTQHVAERITLNSVLSSRVYLGDSRKYAENLSEINVENDFAVGIDTHASFNEQYTEALNAELFSYFSPISPGELFEDSKNPHLQSNRFIIHEGPENSGEMYYISDKYVIKYSEGVFKVSPNTNVDLLEYVSTIYAKNKPEGSSANYQHMPKNILKEIEKLEPRFSFGLFSSLEAKQTEQGLQHERTFHIAFRGTEPDIKEVSKTDTNKNEFIKYFLDDYPNMTHHYDVIKPFVEQAIKLTRACNIPNLEITGHSLGGSMVDVFLEQNKKNPDLNGIAYQGYAFGNPFGMSTRNKVEQFFENGAGQKIKKTLDSMFNLDAETMVNEMRKKVRNTGKKFLQVGVNTGVALGCTLTHTEPNEVTQFYMKQMAVKLGLDPVVLASNIGVRFVCNLCKITKQVFSPTKLVDENFKQIEHNPDSKLISVQHSGDPVPTGGAFIYQHKGTRYLVSDKNEVFNKNTQPMNLKDKILSLAGTLVEKVTGYSINNHKAYNYVASCVQRVDFTTNSRLAQAIRNVNHTFESITPQFERTTNCRTVFANIKNLRNIAYPVSHSVDKEIPA